MARQHGLTPLEEALEAWRDARAGTIAEAENLRSFEFHWKPTKESRTVAALLRHIMEVGMMAAGELSRRDTDFHRAPWPELLAMHAKPLAKARNRRTILQLLRTSLADAERRLRRAGEREMKRKITRFDGLKGTKLEWLHHAIAHEEYHRGQLALYARMMGREPALTRLIRTGK
ncbi:MAG TPA: DinB family protein [Thermoanaerobaculia bacterium]|nr:DinB family protein [Thermoanaerobaculia bacterium]